METKERVSVVFLDLFNEVLDIIGLDERATINIDEGRVKSFDINKYIAGLYSVNDNEKVKSASLLLTNPKDGNAALFYVLVGALIDCLIDIDISTRNHILVEMLNHGKPSMSINNTEFKFIRMNHLVAFDVLISE